jgi:hypothetical protein
MERAGESRRWIAQALTAAYGDGLLSERTLAHRLDVLLGSAVVEPAGLVGDLALRSPRRPLTDTVAQAVRAALRAAGLAGADASPQPPLLALDWSGAQDELLVGRHRDCDVVLTHATVSRRHARLRFRDGNWILRDLDSTNGTTVNGRRVVRCRLLPGDRLTLGDESLLVD